MKKYILGFIAFCSSIFGTMQAQVSVNILLQPPYSPYFTDYLTYENKAVITFTQSPSNFHPEVYVRGSVTGDNGVELRTKPEYKPQSPLILNSTVTVFGGAEIAEYFSWSNVETKGVNIAQIVQNNGLPEGNYTVCLEVYDWSTNQLLNTTGTGCFTFPIKQVEAPVLIAPSCAGEVVATPQQTVLFSWSASPGAPPNTRYVLAMVPLYNASQNPNDALNTLTTPPFFEKDLMVPGYLYTLADPQLLPGTTYAWRVTIYDPTNKTLFRNQGISAACTFVYKPDPLAAIKNADEQLLVTSPACKKGTDTIALSNTGATLNWVWQQQLDNAAFLEHAEKLYINGRKPYTYELSLLPQWKSFGESPKQVAVYKNISGPQQFWKISQTDFSSLGIQLGWPYVLQIRCLDSVGAEMAKTSSCKFIFKKTNTAVSNTIKISGQLKYQFENGTEFYGANNVAFTAQIAETADNPAAGMYKKSGGTGYLGGIRQDKPYTSAITDADGNFVMDLDISETDTGNKFVRFYINSPYYQSPKSNIPISLNFPTKNKELGAKKDSAMLGEIKVKAWGYTLKVTMGKGFPSFFYDTISQKLQNYSYAIDTMTINPQSKIPAGINMKLYRKSKAEYIPFFECNKKVSASMGQVAVAEAKTVIEKDAKGSEKTVVYFKNLLLNLTDGDMYYLKADIGKTPAAGGGTGTGGKNPFAINKAILNGGIAKSETYEDLEAPEQVVVFKTKSTSSMYGLYETDYKFISKTPPMSSISGKLVHRWPSDPAVVRPLGNAKFVVKVKYLMDGNDLPPLLETKECRINKYGFVGDDKNGSDGFYANAYGENGIVVGTGTTDAAGNFDINIINHNSKGELTKDAHWDVLFSVKDPKCEKNTPVNTNPFEKLTWGMNEEWGTDMLGNQGLNESGNVLDFSMDKTSGFNGMGLQFGSSANSLMNLGGGNLGGGVGAGLGKSLNGKSGGPLPNEYAIEETADGPHSVERVFTIELLSDWAVYYDKPKGPSASNIDNQFVLQAFDKKNIGTFTAWVDERRVPNKIKATVKGSPSTPLTGAMMVVFRLPNSKVPLMPKGEGSETHPMKPLMKATFAGNPSINNKTSQSQNALAADMEWIVDHAIMISGDGTFDLGDLKLTTAGGKYYYQISSNPSGTGTAFETVIAPIEQLTAEVKLYPSRIAGRLMDLSSSKGLKSGSATLTLTPKSGSGITKYTVAVYDTSGYFEIINGKNIPGIGTPKWENQTQMKLLGTAWGYKSKTETKELNKEGLQLYYAMPLEPGGKISGRVVDEKGNPVEAYIVREDGMVFENKVFYVGKFVNGKIQMTLTGGDFTVPAPGFTKVTIKIVPKDVGYFDTSITQSIAFDTKLGNVVVFRRKHRIYLKLDLKNADGTPAMVSEMVGIPAGNFKATVNNDQKLSATNGSGGIYLEFENVSVNQYNILVEDEKNLGYIPVSLNLSNKESRDVQTYKVTMRKGYRIKGTVTMAGKPLKNARIYVEHQSNYQSYNNKVAWNALEARSGADGKYEILGVPSVSGKLIVHATMDTSFVVAGTEKEWAIGSATADFDLQAFSEISLKELYGFPFAVEQLEVIKGGRYKITGLVDLGGNTSAFQWLDPNTKVRVRDVYFENTGGKMKPVENKLPLDATANLKMKYLNKYNILVTNANAKSKTFEPLYIEKTSNEGFLSASASIVDNSFNFPSSYLNFNKTGSFHLGLKSNDADYPSTVFHVISTSAGAQQTYYLSKSDGKEAVFSFLGFEATADSKKSFIDNQGKIHLAVKVSGKIPNTSNGVVDFTIPDLVLDNNKVYPAAGSGPLNFKLQSWNLEVKDWKIDPTKGGIVSNNCLVKTGVVDVPAYTFNLRSDLFVLKDFNPSEIQLGGGVLTLKNVSPSAILVFDEKCGSDLGPHWRLSIAKNGTSPAAVVDAMPPYLNAAINLEYIQLISYGNENILSIMNQTPIPNVFNNPLVKFRPTNIVSGADYFTVLGDAEFNVPRLSACNMGIDFKRSAGKLVGSIQPLSMGFEGLGYVQYTTDDKQKPNIDWVNQTWTIAGFVQEPGKFNPIPCNLVLGKNQAGRVFLKENFKLALVSDSKGDASNSALSLTLSNNIAQNGMWVAGNDWNNLRFSGTLNDPQSSSFSKPGAQTKMDFTVYGEISASSESLSVSNEFAFGKLEMTYDFPSKELRGVLTVPDGTAMGSWTFGGVMEMKYSPKGFLVSGAGSLNTGTLLVDGFGTFNIGFLLANYSLDQPVIDKVTKYSRDPKGQCWLQENKANFKGFYFVGGYDIINTEAGFDIAVASIYFQAQLGVEAALGMNFANNDSKFSIGGHGNVSAGMSAITGTSVSGSMQAHATASAMYKKGQGMSVNGNANLTLGFSVCQSFAVTTSCWDESKEAGLDFGFGGSKGSYFDYHLGNPGTLKGCK